MWLLNECVFYVQFQAAKPVYSVMKLFCLLTNRKSGFWKVVLAALIRARNIHFLKRHVSFYFLGQPVWFF